MHKFLILIKYFLYFCSIYSRLLQKTSNFFMFKREIPVIFLLFRIISRQDKRYSRITKKPQTETSAAALCKIDLYNRSIYDICRCS